MTGIRVYMEGFRVLPYGESSNDWLEIELDYSRRSRSFSYLTEFDATPDSPDDKDDALTFLANRNYFGAVFLTQAQSW